jgi:ketosteroid isomerase-like protein
MRAGDVEVVRAMWDAWERRDPSLFDLYTPDVVWDMTRSNVPGMGLYHGHEGVRAFFEEWLGAFDDFYAIIEDVIDAEDHVVFQVRQGGRGKGSGVNVEMPVYWQAFFVRDGKVARVEVHRDREEALASGPAAT